MQIFVKVTILLNGVIWLFRVHYYLNISSNVNISIKII